MLRIQLFTKWDNNKLIAHASESVMYYFSKSSIRSNDECTDLDEWMNFVVISLLNNVTFQNWSIFSEMKTRNNAKGIPELYFRNIQGTEMRINLHIPFT